MIDDHTIPERSQRHKNKSKHRPYQGIEYTGKPIGKNPQDYDGNAWKENGNKGQQARHTQDVLRMMKESDYFTQER